jgi:hypothetical protein
MENLARKRSTTEWLSNTSDAMLNLFRRLCLAAREKKAGRAASLRQPPPEGLLLR